MSLNFEIHHLTVEILKNDVARETGAQRPLDGISTCREYLFRFNALRSMKT